MKIFLGILIVVILWSIWGYFSSRVEQAQYSILTKTNRYEIREYPTHIVAETIVEGTFDEALNDGFSIIAGYIFGGNTKKESIAMTAPVTTKGTVSEKIAMTAPVRSSVEDGVHVVSFVMPKSYTLLTLPTPNDSRVKLIEVPTKKMAVLRFSWGRSSARIEKKEKELLAMLSRDGVEVIGNPSFAGYNAPFTPPWMNRHEVMIEVR